MPPIATLSTCTPRQIASVGVPLRTAACASAMSNASTSALHAVGVGMSLGSVARRIDVGAADQHQPVEAPDDVVGLGVGDRDLEHRRLLPAGSPDRVEVAP